MDIAQYMNNIGIQARAASRDMARADTKRKNDALNAIADQSRDLREITGVVYPRLRGFDARLQPGLPRARVQAQRNFG